MTRDELLDRMSGEELTQRIALEAVRAKEWEKERKRQERRL